MEYKKYSIEKQHIIEENQQKKGQLLDKLYTKIEKHFEPIKKGRS